MLDTAVLSQAQREQYQRNGWVAVPGLVDSGWLERLRRVTDEFVDASRELTESNILYDLDVGHMADDLLGPDVKFHHSKLNFKAPRGGEEVKWHQDIQFWPHTNYDLLTIGVFLEDVEAGMGEVGFVPGSHDGPLFDLYDEDDRWTGALRDHDVEVAGVGAADSPIGPAGTITVHNCRTVHGSAPNRSDRPRPLLLQTYVAADAFAYTDLVKQSPHGEELVRGESAR